MSKDRKKVIIICSAAILFYIGLTLVPHYFFWQGKNAFNKQNYLSAKNNFHNALRFNRNNKDYKYYYTQSLANLPPTLSVQQEMFAISASKERDSVQQFAELKVGEWRNNVIRNIGDNYIEQAPSDNGIIRWDVNKFPLKVSITDNSGITLPNYYKAEIIRAFNQWQTSTGFIKFNISENANADIFIKIVPLPNDVCTGNVCKYVVGFTTPKIKNNILNSMTITLYAKDPSGNFFSDKELYNTILHEIGHALGIMGHSYSSEDLMYMSNDNVSTFYAPYRSSFQYLSSKDINTIKLLYKLIPSISNTPISELDKKGLVYTPIILGTSEEISSRKLKEAQNYVKQAPDLAGGYVDMAIAYSELGKNNEAVKSLNKALTLAKTNDEKFLVTYNLAAMYLNMNKYDKALEYATQAQNLKNSEDVNELIMMINHQKSLTK